MCADAGWRLVLTLALNSNSYWIGEDTPCITYGLRGVVHATVEVQYLHIVANLLLTTSDI